MKIGMMRKMLVSAAMLAVAACQNGENTDARAGLTKRQADSALGASGLPGATGITRAITAGDSAAARSSRLDSLATEN